MTNTLENPGSVSDAEKTVIGVCLKRPRMIPQIREAIRSSDISTNNHRMIYEAVMSVAARGDEPDLLLANAECEKLYPGRNLTALMIECMELEYRAAMVDQYCGIIKDASARRTIKDIADMLIAGANEPTTEIAQTVDEARDRLRSVINVRGEWLDHQDVILDTYEDAAVRAKGGLEPCISGIPALEELTGGFMPGEYTIIGARPSVGKTALAIAIAIASARKEKPKHVAFVSAEMTKCQIGQRMFSNLADVNGMKLRRPECMTETDWDALAHGLNAHAGVPIKYLFTQRYIEDIIAQARRLYDMGANDLLIVDYIQMLDTRAKFKASDDRLRVGYISKQLAAIAKDLNIPVIGLAQLARQNKDHATMPRLDALKDSGNLEQDADSVILLHEPDWRDDAELNDRERIAFDECRGTPKTLKLLNVAKQRMGEKGTVATIFDGSRNKWTGLQTAGQRRG